MKRDDVLQILADHHEELRQQFGVKTLALFGSVARNEATETSDVDLLVEFARPVGLFGLFALQDHLAQLLGCAVDLGTPDSLKPRIRALVLAESLHVGCSSGVSPLSSHASAARRRCYTVEHP
jgi:predicted nucleotidyltransferase